MPPDESTAVAAPQAAPAPVVSQTPAKDTTADLIAKHAALAAKAVAAEDQAKPEPKTEAKPKAEAKKAKIDPKSIKLEAPAVEAEPEAIREKARFHLKHGDVAKAIDTAFGDLKEIDGTLPDGVREALARKLGVKSEQWEKVRKYEQGVKRQFAAKEADLTKIVDNLKKEYGPLHSARQAYEQGDFDAAFKSAFGEDLADFQRKAIGQRLKADAQDPEVRQLKAQLQRMEQERVGEKQKLAEAQAKATEQRDINAYVQNLQAQLNESDDPQIVKYAARPRFSLSEAVTLMPRVNAAVPILPGVKLAFTKTFVYYVKDRLLDRWTDGMGVSSAAGNDADDTLVEFAREHSLPLISHEGYGPRGIDPSKRIRKQARKAGVEVILAAGFYEGKIDEDAVAEAFLERYKRNAPAYVKSYFKEHGRKEGVQKVLVDMGNYYRHILLGEVDGGNVPVRSPRQLVR